MSRQKHLVPKPRQHKGRSVVDCYFGEQRRTVTLGAWGSKEADTEYRKLVTQLMSSAPAVPRPRAGDPADGFTVAEALLLYTQHIDAHYRKPDGTPTVTPADIKITLGYLKRLFAGLPLSQFDVPEFKAVRKAMIDDGRVRKQVNKRASQVRSWVKWCVEAQLPVAVGALGRLQAVRSLTHGRDGVKDGARRGPADPAAVAALLPHLPPAVAAAVQLIRLTGARPSEILNATAGELDTTKGVWELRPTYHKGTWRGSDRVLYLGPAAQDVARPWLTACEGRDPGNPLLPTRNGTLYDHRTAGYAIRRAAERSGLPGFTLYALRHLRAVELREQFGPDHVRATLGHAALDMSDHYSKAADRTLAVTAAAQLG